MKTLFGTDGIRGEAGKFPLDAPTVKLIGASLARYLKTVLSKSPSIIIGRDTRESGDWIESSLVEGHLTQVRLVFQRVLSPRRELRI